MIAPHHTPDFFEKGVTSNFGFPPTSGQARLFYAFSRFICSEKPRCALLIRGYAGTGKTTCVSAMVNTLSKSGIRSVLLAPTGRAAKVLGNYSGHRAFTIHRQIYTRESDTSGQGSFALRHNELENTVFFVDEASMIGNTGSGEMGYGDLLEDLVTHVFSGEGCRLVLIGDTAQLPPVGSELSPALKLDYLKSHYFLNIAEIELDEVIRQAEGSGILRNATAIRKLITSGKPELPGFEIGAHKDIQVVEGDPQPVVEEAFARYGREETIIITRSNKRANLFNRAVRNRILWHEEEINSGDRMMVLKNNYYWLDPDNGAVSQNTSAAFIANGDVIEIKRIHRFEDRGEFRFAKATVSMVDYPELQEFEVWLLCNSIWEDTASLSQQKLNALGNLIAEDYPDITNRGLLKRAVYRDEYFNALQVKFAYAITCHKAQGGQWPCVFVDQGYVSDEMVGTELNRWFYTAITRAQEQLYLVGFEDRLITG